MSIAMCERYMAAEYYPQRFRAHFHSYRVEMQVFFFVIAEKWLKQDYIMNGKEKEGEKRGLKWKRG